MSSDVSIKLGIEGEKEWKKALEETSNTLKQLNSGLKASQAEFAAHDGAMSSDAKSTALMRKTLETQKKYVEQLGKAVEWSSDKYGAASKKTTSYIVSQNRARESVAKMEQQLADTDREMEELGRDAGKVGSQIENGLSDAAQNASQELDGLLGKVSSTLGISPGMTLGAGIAAVGATAVGAVQSIVGSIDGIVVETDDRRRNINYTQTNAEIGYYDWGKIADVLFEVEAILGDEDSAAEGVNNLMAAGLSQEDVKRAADVLMGAAIKWNDETIKFEGVADGLQETIMSGKAAGPFAELLDRTGLKADAFNEVIKTAVDDDERRKVTMQWLESTGLALTKEKYAEEHREEVDHGEADVAYKNAVTNLGTTLLPVSTALTDLKTQLVNTTNDLATVIVDSIVEGKRKAEEEKIKKDEIKEEINEENGDYDRLEELNRQIEEEWAKGTPEGNMRALELEAEHSQALKNLAETTRSRYAEDRENGSMIEMTKEEMNEDGQEAGGKLTTVIVDSVVESKRKTEEEKTKKDEIKEEINAENGDYNRLEELNRQIEEEWAKGTSEGNMRALELEAEHSQALKNLATTTRSRYGDNRETGSMIETTKKEMNEGGQEAGGELVDGLKTGIQTGTESMETASKTAMQSVFAAMASSVAEDGNAVIAKAGEFVNAYNATMSQIMVPNLMGEMPSPVGAAGYGNPGNIRVDMSISGKKVGEAVASYVSSSVGRSSSRAMNR